MEQIKRFCINCGKELTASYQKKFCSKQCESSYKKGRKVGKYSESRVDAMILAKEKAYKERYLDSIKLGMQSLIKEKYISKISILLYHLQKLYPSQEDINIHRIKKYFNTFPEDYSSFKEARNFPVCIQRKSPEEFISYINFLKENIKGNYIVFEKIKNSEIIKNYNLSFLDVKNSCIILGVNFSEKNPTYQKKSPIRVTTKWAQAKEILDKAQFENFFQKPFLVGVYKEWEDIVKKKGKELGVSFPMCKKYIEEKGIKIKVSYSKEKLAIYKIKKYLKISEEEIKEIALSLEEANNYFEMKNILNNFLLNTEIKDLLMNKNVYSQKFDFLKKYFSYLSSKFLEESTKEILKGSYTTSKDGGSSIEAWVIQKFKELKIPFETQVILKSSEKGYQYKIDLLVNKSKCIEIQGDYWHAHPLEYNYKITSSKINSVFPLFIYPKPFTSCKKEINEMQKRGIEKEIKKHSLMCKKYGAENVYYIWEYDIRNYPEAVIDFIKGTFLNEL